MKYWSLLMVLALATLPACNTQPLFPTEPLIQYIDISPRTIREYQDSILIQFSFQDGDGDLGDEEGGETYSLLVADNRSFFPDSLRTLKFKLPNLQSTTKNPSIKGKITLTYPASILTPGFSRDSTTYSIYILDKAGHKSNIILTDQIYITP